jgi:hypothetical protein
MTDDEVTAERTFVIRASSLIRHSEFGFRHSPASQ